MGTGGAERKLPAEVKETPSGSGLNENVAVFPKSAIPDWPYALSQIQIGTVAAGPSKITVPVINSSITFGVPFEPSQLLDV